VGEGFGGEERRRGEFGRGGEVEGREGEGGGSVWDLEIPHGTVGDIGRGEEDEHA